jgi:hypothetical protein
MQEKSRGGARPGAGAKKKSEVEKANHFFLSMIKLVHNVETDEEAKLELAKTLYSFERGQMFIAEHLFGKPVQTIDNNVSMSNFDITKIYDNQTQSDME